MINIIITHSIYFAIIIFAFIVYVCLIRLKLFKNCRIAEKTKHSIWENEVFWAALLLIICMTLLMEPNFFAEKVKIDNGFSRLCRAFAYSFYNSLTLFGFNGNLEDVRHLCAMISENTNGSCYAKVVSWLATAGYIISPFVTVVAILSLFKEILAFFRYLKFPKKNSEVYVFSELNEKSIRLAEDICSKDSKAPKIVFTDIFDRNDESNFELVSRAKKIGAICTKKDITSVYWISKSCIKKRQISKYSFFLIGENEDENLTQTISLIEKYKDNKFANEKNGKQVFLYLFSKSVTSELIISNLLDDETHLFVKRIDANRSLIYDYLYNNGEAIINTALESKSFDILILGMGEQGFEMLKALLWFCKMSGFSQNITVLDKKADIKERFLDKCPAFKDDEEFNTSVTFGPFCDFDDDSFYDETLHTYKSKKYIFISTGDDEQNIAIAKRIREKFCNIKKDNADNTIPPEIWNAKIEELKKQHSNSALIKEELEKFVMQTLSKAPIITTVVYNSNIKYALEDSLYNIDIIGDIDQMYSDESIINTKLYAKCDDVHKAGAGKQSLSTYDKNKFYMEYNSRSTLALVIYHIVWGKVIDSGKCDLLEDWKCIKKYINKNQNDPKKVSHYYDALLKLYSTVNDEKARWITYMKTEGFALDEFSVANTDYADYSKLSFEKAVRNVQKAYIHKHNLLSPFETAKDAKGEVDYYFLEVYQSIVKNDEQKNIYD